VNGIAEEGVQYLHVSSVPRYLYCMAYGALHTGGGSVIFTGNGGVESFCHLVYYLIVVCDHDYRGTQILIALDMRRHTDLVNDFRNVRLKIENFALLNVHRSVYTLAQVIKTVRTQKACGYTVIVGSVNKLAVINARYKNGFGHA